jgi:oligopeptide transport system ATP-binding protein
MQSEAPGSPVHAADGTILRVNKLCTHFPSRRRGRRGGAVKAVDGVTFAVRRGTTLGLVGESGCGKSTLARTILRLIPATSGSVWFDGRDVFRLRPSELRAIRREMQIIFQDPVGSLNPRMNVGTIVGEALSVHGLARSRPERDDRVAELLARVGLSRDDLRRYPHEFSGGQRQRIGIARALALEPKLIVCDEPVSALDVSIQSQILNLLADLQQEFGLTYLFIAHDLAVVRNFCDEIAVMYLGKVVEQAPAAELFENPRHPYTRALIAAAPTPDPRSRRERAPLAGEPPDPASPPPGCAFHPRCPLAIDRCTRTVPPLEAPAMVAAGHVVACHRAAETQNP